MKEKSYLATLLAIWLIGMAFVGLTAKALPAHTVAGGIYGPGGDMSSGPTNPANAAGMVFYSTSQVSYTLISGPDSFSAATGTEPAIYARDVGVVWDWLAGDEMVVVFETIKGATWTGANHTTSLTATLQTGSTVQDIGDVTMEPLPTITLSKGANWIKLEWSPMTDTADNLQSYNVYRAATPLGPFGIVGTPVPDAPGTRSFNDTSLVNGPYCYQISINYQRDLSGGLYETTGRSGMVCTVLAGIPPNVVSTDPFNSETNVPLTDPVIITFSETMNTATVSAVSTPIVTFTTGWGSSDTILTLTHTTPFTMCQQYQIDVQGKDMDGNDLSPNPTYTFTFTALCDMPYIVSTSPANTAQQVKLTANIIITFSEEMDINTVTNSTAPAILLIEAWSAGNTVLTLSHPATPFTAGTIYTVTITGKDLSGNDLMIGPPSAPNPWTFTTNNPPTATIDPQNTLLGLCCSGGSNLVIPWDMNDAETPVAQLVVWLNYTLGASSGSIAGPLTGGTSSDSYTWPTPVDNGALVIYLTVIDGPQEVAQDTSATIMMDSTAPTVLSTSPTNGATDVVIDAQVVVRFSEPMQASTVIITFNPVVSNLVLTWDSVNMNVTVAHADFAPGTQYTLTVDATAADDCTPGNQMGTAYTTSFTTGTSAKAPNPPAGLAIASQAYNAIGLTWNAPTQYTDGSALPASEIASYRVYRSATATGTKTQIGTSTTTSYTDTTVEQEKTYFYWVTCVNTTGVQSDYSNQVSVTVPKQVIGGFDWLWIVIILIVILVIIGLVLVFARRKKPEEAPEAPPVEGEEVPPEGAPAEEAPPAEAPPAEAPPTEVPPEGAPPETTTPETEPKEGPGQPGA